MQKVVILHFNTYRMAIGGSSPEDKPAMQYRTSTE